MDKIAVYIIFALLLSLSVAISAIGFACCKRWYKAYHKLKSKYERTYSENIRLQHEVYKSNYVIPSVDTKKGRNGNGTK